MCRKLSFCLSCDARSLRWVLSGSICVSVCRCWIFVSAVQPAVMLSAVLWVVWNLLRFVSEMMGDRRVFPYSMTGRVMVLEVAISVSFCLPQVVEVSVLTTLSDLSAFSLVILVCSAKLTFGSSVTPSILGFLTVGKSVVDS